MNLLLRVSFRASLIRNSIVQFIWWVIFFPGFFSTDSFGAVQMARTGVLGNAFTASWAIYVRLFSFHGHAIALLTIINGLVLVYAVTRLGYSLFSGKTAALSTFLITLTPLVSAMGITLWHDILMSAGLVLITSFFINIQKKQETYKRLLILELIPGSVLISFRPNGLPTLALFAVFYICIILKYRRDELVLITKNLMVAMALTSIVTVFASNVIIKQSPINVSFAQEWMRNDISCFADSDAGKNFVEVNIPGIGSTDSWRSSQACTFLNNALITSQERISAERYVPSAWLTLLKQEPFFVLSTHAKRNDYLIPFPISGLPVTPFLHSNIEFKDQGIEWAFPEVAEKARVVVRLWNAGRALFGWAGLWIAVLICLRLFLKRESFTPALAMSVALVGILFVVAPIPDGRYALYVLLVGQLSLIGIVVEWAQTGSNRRPTD
jgi:hypothetical protein